MFKVSHGLEVRDEGDPFMDILERAIESVDVLVTGSTLLEYFPLLASTPTWLPGTGFLRRLKEDRQAAQALWSAPWARVTADLVCVFFELYRGIG